MSLILKQVFALIKLLNSETGANQIAAGAALGFILGMSPMLSIQGLLIMLCVLIFRIQFGAAMLSAFFFSFVAYLLDPVFHKLGLWVLNLEGLKGLFTEMYNMPLVPFTRFNNTVVMGAGIFGIILFPFLFILFRKLIFKYREIIVARIKATPLWKALEATKFYQWYYKYDQYYGN